MATESSPPNLEASQLARLKSERDRFVALAFCWADLLFELDCEETIVFAGGATLSVLGRPPEEIVGTRFSDILAVQDPALISQLLKTVERGARTDHTTIHLAGKFGMTPPFFLAGYRLRDLNGHYFLALRMAGGKVEASRETSVRDGSTGLLDGRAFANLAAKRLDDLQTAGRDAKITLVTLGDMQDLRARLDEASDGMLMSTVGACFRAYSADGDTAVQINENRYGLLHNADLNVPDLEEELTRVIRKVDPRGQGVAVQSATIEVSDTKISEEDMARGLLYVVNRFRESEGDAFTIKSLSTNLSSLMSEAANSIEAFKRVVAQGAFDLAFQPIIDVHTGAINYYEALARFHGSAKDQSPLHQISFAEETGLIAEFDLAVTQKAIDWLDQFPRNSNSLRVAVNVSGQSVANSRYASSLSAKLREYAWVREKLLFEITDSSHMTDLDAANDFIQRLRQAGHRVCLDDFGAGAASFSYLSALEVDFVKLDGKAVHLAQTGSKGRAFFNALTGLCKNLKVKTIAEMVDRKETLNFVRYGGVDFVQGFLFGEPSTQIKDFNPLLGRGLFRDQRGQRRAYRPFA